MRIIHFATGGVLGIAADEDSGWHGLTQADNGFPGTLPELIAHESDPSSRADPATPRINCARR